MWLRLKGRKGEAKLDLDQPDVVLIHGENEGMEQVGGNGTLSTHMHHWEAQDSGPRS